MTRLLSRVFCLFSFEDAGVEVHNTDAIILDKLDFDIAQFCTLLERYKFTWRTTMQVILFRAFLSGRSGLTNVQTVLRKMCFQKKANSGLTGLIFKVFLSRASLDDKHANFFKEFSFLSKDDLAKIVHYGCQLWVMLKRVLERANQSTLNEGQQLDGHLEGQFREAHGYLTNKVRTHNLASHGLFKDALDVLERHEQQTREMRPAFSQPAGQSFGGGPPGSSQGQRRHTF
jgi:hypothetical protein